MLLDFCDWTRTTSIAQWLAFLLLDPGAPGSIPSISGIFSAEKNVDVAEVNQQCCLEESVQWLENLDQTHIVPASGKLVLQKSSFWSDVAAPVLPYSSY